MSSVRFVVKWERSQLIESGWQMSCKAEMWHLLEVKKEPEPDPEPEPESVKCPCPVSVW